MSLRSMFGFADKSEQVRLYDEELPVSEYDGVLIEYIRPYYDPELKAGRREPIGCVVALKDERGVVRYGWSLCNPKDHFVKEFARKQAVGRALTEHQNRVNRPKLVPALRYVIRDGEYRKVDVVAEAKARLQERVAKYFG